LQQKIGVELLFFLLSLEVALAQRDVTRAGSGNLATDTQRDLLDLAAGGEKLGGLFLNRALREIVSRGYYRLAFLCFGSGHVDP
jgi:hypothetical protein